MRDKSYLSQQKDIKRQLLQTYYAKEYSLESPFVAVDPFGISPLTALVMFETEEPTQLSLKIQGKDVHTTFSQTFDGFSRQHQIPVHALYADTSNQVVLTATTQQGTSRVARLDIRTKPVPADCQRLKIHKADPEKMARGLTYVLTNSNHTFFFMEACKESDIQSTYTAAFDCNGDIRWVLTEKCFGAIGPFLPLRNGNLLLSSDKPETGTYFSKSCYEINHLGEVIREYCQEGIHHDAVELPGGNLVVLCRETGSKYEEDYMVEFDRVSGNIVREWDMKDVYPVHYTSPNYGANQEVPEKKDWLHMNTLKYHEPDNSFVASGRNQDIVFKFERDTKKIKWLLTQPGAELTDELRSVLLKPVGEPFSYPNGQHCVTILPNGDVLIFNNMSFADKYEPDTEDSKAAKFSSAVVYRIDENEKTVRQMWRSDEEMGKIGYSPIMGNADYLAPSHYWVNYSSRSFDKNGVQQKHCLDFLSQPAQNSMFVEYLENQVIFQAEYDGNFGHTYRSHRLLPYFGCKECDIR